MKYASFRTALVAVAGVAMLAVSTKLVADPPTADYRCTGGS